MTDTVSAERISNLIARIYDCAIEPAQWHATLRQICDDRSFLHAMLSVYRIPVGLPMKSTQIPVGLASKWVDAMPDYGQDMLEFWGGYDRVQSFPIDEPTASSRVVNPTVAADNRFYREWMAPQGIVDLIGVPHSRTRSLLGSVVFARHADVGIATESDLETLRLLAPHVHRAIEIGNVLDMRSIEVTTFEATLDALSVATLLLDAAGTVIYANARAQAMLSDRSPIKQEAGVLRLMSAVANKALADALACTALDETSLAHRGIGIPSTGPEQTPFVAHLLPLKRGKLRPRLEARATAAIFIAPAESPPRMPSDALALVYNLTPAELRVLELLVDGLTIEEISDRLGVGANTTRTHLKRLFAKTGVRRQVELVRIVTSMSLRI